MSSRNQFAVEIGYVAGGVSYARRVRDSDMSIGAGVWGAWEPPNTFDRNVWEPIGFVVFARYQPAQWFHADAGPTITRYQWADDCSACSGNILGLRAAALIGYRFVYVGPDVSIGYANDDLHGGDIGVIWGGHVRLVLRWGR